MISRNLKRQFDLGDTMKKLLLGCLFFALCSWSAAEISLEQLLGVSVDESGITFQVTSNGCTEREDFNFFVEEIFKEMGPMLPAFELHYYINVIRLRQDQCEAVVPYGTKIFLTFEELGIQFGKFHVNNPIGGDKILTVRER